MSQRVSHQEIVKKLLDAKAVDFAAIGKVIADVGPMVALWEDGDNFCGTGRHFIHLYDLNDPQAGVEVDDLGSLRGATGELGSE